MRAERRGNELIHMLHPTVTIPKPQTCESSTCESSARRTFAKASRFPYLEIWGPGCRGADRGARLNVETINLAWPAIANRFCLQKEEDARIAGYLALGEKGTRAKTSASGSSVNSDSDSWTCLEGDDVAPEKNHGRGAKQHLDQGFCNSLGA